eukprot:COSAG03_NODE_20353_length_320_cov_1.343891_1_plen_34_part_10
MEAPVNSTQRLARLGSHITRGRFDDAGPRRCAGR